jgi:hypothetical protein
MPKLPAGMFKRKGRPGYYLRLYRGGRERYLALGTDYEKAVEKAEAARKGEMPTKGERVTVGQAAERWLATYVRTQRTEQGQSISEQRVRDYLVPFMGHMLLERLNGEDVRAYRLWLERTTKLSLCSVWHVLSDCRCLLTGARMPGSWNGRRSRGGSCPGCRSGCRIA